MLSDDFHVFDTTLRDGAQREGISYSVADKLAVARLLDSLGVGFIEGGWPGAVPKDTEFFARAAGGELSLRHATLVAFGATRKAGVAVAEDRQVQALLDSRAPVITLVAKSDVWHVERALRTSREENLAMVSDTVGYLTAAGRRVFLDCEHFFDGYAHDRDYGLRVLDAAAAAGADVGVLCDTNGGMLPMGISQVVSEVAARAGIRLGIHTQDDTGCAVANTLAAVAAGVTHVQGTANGYGERAGNANLFSVIGGLVFKMGLDVLPPGTIAESVRVSHAIAEIANLAPDTHAPYVGSSAFAHKAGLHASAIKAGPELYNHLDPGAGRQQPANPDHRDGRPGLGRAEVGRAGHGRHRPAGRGQQGGGRGSRSASRPAGPTRPPTPRSSCWSARSCRPRPRSSRWSPTG